VVKFIVRVALVQHVFANVTKAILSYGRIQVTLQNKLKLRLSVKQRS